MYCLFPLIYLTNNNGSIFDLTSLGLLNEQNGFIIIQSLFAMTMLIRKCIVLMRDLNPIRMATSHWKKVYNRVRSDDLMPWIEVKTYESKINLSGFGNSELYRLIVARYEDHGIAKPRATVLIPMSNHMELQAVTSMSSDSRGTKLAQNSLSAADNGQKIISPSSPKSTDDISSNDTKFYDSGKFSVDSGISIYDEQSQCRRKFLIVMCGLSFIAIGLTILILFVSFINVDFNEKCIDPTESWLINHPESGYYNKFCTYQVVNIFSDYPCNCRQLRVNNVTIEEFGPDILELSLIKYNNLEGISLDGINYDSTSGSAVYYFTKEMLDDLVCLHSICTVKCMILMCYVLYFVLYRVGVKWEGIHADICHG